MPLTQICRLDRDVKDGYRLMCCGFVVVHGGTAVSRVRGCMVFQIQEGSSLDGRFLMFTCTLKSCKYLEKQATKRCRSNDENSQGAQLWNSYIMTGKLFPQFQFLRLSRYGWKCPIAVTQIYDKVPKQKVWRIILLRHVFGG